MTKKELLKKIEKADMDAEIIIVDATDFDDTEYAVSSVECYPLDVKSPDEIHITINEGVFAEETKE